MTEAKRFTIPFGDCELTLETGRLAKQAGGAVLAQWGDTVVLAAAVASDKARADIDFFPLTVDYREKFYAAGRIPGGFFKREGRPGTQETICSRLIDRPIRPLFPDGYKNETQVYITVLSMDQKHLPDVPALIASSAALHISNIPFNGPIAACRVARIDEKLLLNPTIEEMEKSDLDLLAAGTKDAICMVESGSDELSEEIMLEALSEAQKEISRVVTTIEEMRTECGKAKMEFEIPEIDAELFEKIENLFKPKLPEIHKTMDKKERSDLEKSIIKEIIEALIEEYPEQEAVIKSLCKKIYVTDLRRMMIEEKIRADGRGFTDIRKITCEVDSLPCTHGTAIFTRGQTQALATLTLGTPADRQRIDNLMGSSEKAFLLHYNFPSYSVGECRRPAGPGRREIGHGMLAERAIFPVLPDNEEFPYTIRIVSEILESNGSSSMASVCAGTLALMDGGVPVKAPVAGIAMGLIKEGDKTVILSDILGLEDHIGDMDFKVAGSKNGITALQMDIKIGGIDYEIMKKALEQAKGGREFILGKMLETLPEHRDDLKPHAPRIKIIHIPVEKIGGLIGPGGKIIKDIIERTGCKIDIDDDGSVYVASNEAEAMKKAVDLINARTAEAVLGKTYTGKVMRVTNFGAFVEILPGKDGLVHISELDLGRVAKVEDICMEGDTLMVKVIGIDPQSGKIRLSRRELLREKEHDSGQRDEQRR
jgi:polyribonucleotide nucleotidyltransferase